MRTRSLLAAGLVTAATAISLGAPAGAGAAPFFPPCSSNCRIVVNSATDAVDAHPGDGVCETATGNGVCTLRGAIQEANASTNRPPYQSEIDVPGGLYRLTLHGSDDDSAVGDLDLRFFGQIVGAGQSKTVVDGDGADRVFDLHSSDERISHMTVQGGRATDGPGGGIRAGAIDYLEYLNVSGNEAVAGEAPDSGLGGGIAAADSWVGYSTLSYNTARDGGGLWFHGAQSGFGSDAIVHNHAAEGGGGLVFQSDDAYFSNLTVSGNTAGDHGGGIDLRGPSSFWFFDAAGATIVSNTAPAGRGGGIWRGAVGDSQRAVAGLIVARNGGGDCAGPGTLFSRGSNLDGDSSCGFDKPGDRAGVDPLIGPLAYNGGPTQTRALLAGSPAIDAWTCNGATWNEPAADQRGATRPQGAACDAGAYESGSCCPTFEPAFHPAGGKPSPPPTVPPSGDCGQVVQGTDGPDQLTGNERRNSIMGRGGDDLVYGLANGDCLRGGPGDDYVSGGSGVDQVFGGSGNDRLYGGADEDRLYGGSGNDRLSGGGDDDRIYGGKGNDRIKGGDGYDVIVAGPGDDRIDATGHGLDTVDCGPGHDYVRAYREERLFRCEKVKLVD